MQVSGGKDSDAMTHHLLERRQAEGWSGEVMMVHADLGSRDGIRRRSASAILRNKMVCRCMLCAGSTVI